MGHDRHGKCGYCGRPLRLVSGFCAGCHAPAVIARRPELIAQSSRAQVWQYLEPMLASEGSLAVAESERQLPQWIYLAGAVGILAIAISLSLIVMQIQGNAASSAPPQTAISVSATANGVPQTHFTIGSAVYVTFTVTIASSNSPIIIRLTPQTGLAQTLNEVWPHGVIRRSIVFAPMKAGIWKISLSAGSAAEQSVAITVSP